MLCTGTAATEMVDWLEISTVHGQVDHFRYAPDSPRGPRVPVVGNGYLVPDPAGGPGFSVGATYEYAPWTPEDATQRNLHNNQAFIGHTLHAWQGRNRAARAVSSDRTPVAGRLAENLWIATAYGSMAASLARFCASIVASDLAGWMPPCATAVAQALRPERFRERQARRGPAHLRRR